MQETGGLTNRFTGRSEEGDDVVIRLPLDFTHSIKVAAGGMNRGHRPIWNAPAAVPRLADGDLHHEPQRNLALVAPDAAHFRPGVALDHVVERAPLACPYTR